MNNRTEITNDMPTTQKQYILAIDYADELLDALTANGVGFADLPTVLNSIKEQWAMRCNICVVCDQEFLYSAEKALRGCGRLCPKCWRRDLSYAVGKEIHHRGVDWVKTLIYFDMKCAYCQQRPYEEVEHYVPLSAGGADENWNVVPACRWCNSTKHTYNPRNPNGRTSRISQEIYDRVGVYLDDFKAKYYPLTALDAPQPAPARSEQETT